MTTTSNTNASHTFVKTTWRDVPNDTRLALSSFKVWLQRDLDVRIHIDYWRHEQDEYNAAAAIYEQAQLNLMNPHRSNEAQQDKHAWAGQVTTQRPDTVRLNVDVPPIEMLRTLAHEARHVWQLEHFESFLPAHLIRQRNIAGVRDRMERDAKAYTDTALVTWAREYQSC